MKVKTIVKEAMALFAITIVAALLLGFVYEITKEPIEEQKLLQKQRAYQMVFLDADTFEGTDSLNALVETAPEVLAAQDYNNITIQELLEAKTKSGSVLGYVMTIASNEGYGGELIISLGIKADKMVNGIEILTISETPGLGAKANTPEFKNQFANKEVEAFAYTKKGKTSDNEIDAISGATITTNAMTNMVNAGIYYINSYVNVN